MHFVIDYETMLNKNKQEAEKLVVAERATAETLRGESALSGQ